MPLSSTNMRAVALRAVVLLALAGLALVPLVGVAILILLFVVYRCARLSRPAKLNTEFCDTLIGHRGCRHCVFSDGTLIPENSMAAFAYAADQGANGVELDTRLSADGVPVVMHDATSARMLEGADSSVELSKLTVERIRSLKWRRSAPAADCPNSKAVSLSHRASRLSDSERAVFDAPVPTLEEVIVFCKSRNLKLMIESKEWARPREMARVICALFAKHECHASMFVASFNPLLLYFVRRLDARIETMMLFTKQLLAKQAASGAECFPWWVPALAPFVDPLLTLAAEHVLPTFLGCGLVGAHNVLVHRAMIDAYRAQGIVTDIWVANEVSELRWLQKQHTMITTDFLFTEYHASAEKKR